MFAFKNLLHTYIYTCRDDNNQVYVSVDVDGGWSPWMEWSEFGSCTESCGGGMIGQRRTRECDNPFPEGDGAQCTGDSQEEDQTECNEDPCPGRLICAIYIYSKLYNNICFAMRLSGECNDTHGQH